VPQGLSTLEFMAKGKPVLTMKNDLHDFEVQNAANLKRTDKFKEFKMNVDNIDDYTNSLELLIKSEEAREVIGKLNLDYIEKSYYDTTSSTQRFYEILEETIK
jgi:glycosyltransferase involved in cell wall biosynthesis